MNECINYINPFLFSEEPLDVLDVKETIKIPKGMDKKKKISYKMIEALADAYIEKPTDRNFRRLWDAAYWGIRQHAFRVVNDNDAVDDIISNVFEKILLKHDQFDRTKGKFTTWMYKICWNETLLYLNKKKKEALVDNDIEDLYPSFQMDKMSEKFIDDFDYSDKFDCDVLTDINMMTREDIKKKFLDTSINEIEKFKDERIVTCMKERFTFYNRGEERKNLTLEEIAAKYNYPLTSVKNWINKGRSDLKNVMLEKHFELYEMWKETLD